MLKRHTPDLVELNMLQNSICDVKNYRQLLVRRLASLLLLDGQPVSSQERVCLICLFVSCESLSSLYTNFLLFSSFSTFPSFF